MHDIVIENCFFEIGFCIRNLALSGATPLAEVKEASEELLDHHEIHKRQLKVVNAASGLSKFMVENAERQSMAVSFYPFFWSFSL